MSVTSNANAARLNVVLSDDPLNEPALESFAEAVKGEWAGYEGEFDPSGTPLTIPDYYIPEDFVSWGLEPKGFECTHSTIVRGTKYYVKHLRVLPAVSLFADHVDLETNFHIVDFAESNAAHCFPDGSYSGGPSPVVLDRKSILDKWPSADLTLRIGKRALHCNVKFDFAKRCIVEKVRLVLEQYSCIYCDGADVEGSSGYVEGWPTYEKCSPTQLAGTWCTHDANQVIREKGPDEQPGSCIYLPEGITVGVDEADDGGVRVWLGWLHEPQSRAILERIYSNQGVVVESRQSTESLLS